MTTNKLKLCILLLLFFLTAGLQGQKIQEAIVTAGGNASGSEGSASYSIGQPVYTAIKSDADGSVIQGIQQAFEIYFITGIDAVRELNISFSAYPNPVSDNINLKITGDLTSGYAVSVYDTKGNLLEKKEILSNETDLFMGDLESSVYFLKITQKDKEITTIKVIKK